MTSVWFVSPAHGREALSALCFEQRRRVIDELAARGVDASCVVVACDGNLDLAREHGFHALDRANGPVGWKRNEGIEYACRQGAEYVVPIDSDDWCLADWLLDLPAAGTVRAGLTLGLVDPGGFELTCLGIDPRMGPVGYLPWLVPTSLCGPRPAGDSCRYGDVSMANTLVRAGARWDLASVDDLQAVDFKTPVGLTSYQRTCALNPVLWDTDEPFTRLATRYPADLVERMHTLYREARHG